MTTRPTLEGMKLAGRYEVGPRLAGGHFSDVHEGTDEKTGELVALKVLRQGSGTEAIEEFETEGELLNLLTSASNVVDIQNTAEHVESATVNTTGSTFDVVFRFHVLELADACLTELLVDLPSLSWIDRLDLYRGVIKGAHQSNLGQILNRDYKSENVLLFSRSKNAADAKVSDFGRGRLMTGPARLSPDHYMSGRGDRRFAPPELLFHLAEPTEQGWLCVELYLLGSVLYEMATGVGITSMAIPNSLSLLQAFAPMSPTKRAIAFQSALPGLRARYEQAFLAFESSVPASVRAEASRLLRELCDPDPKRRPTSRRSTSSAVGLHWMLNRIDIMKINLSHAHKEAAELAAKKKRRRLRKVRP